MQRFEHASVVHYVYKVQQSLYRLVTSPEGFRSLWIPDCETIGEYCEVVSLRVGRV
jgi:hypothetical protein